jgi:hypothetical protein
MWRYLSAPSRKERLLTVISVCPVGQFSLFLACSAESRSGVAPECPRRGVVASWWEGRGPIAMGQAKSTAQGLR